MSEKYKFHDPDAIYFVTPTIISWIDLFTRPMYSELICQSLQYCIENKGLRLHAWCIMPSHLHLIISSSQGDCAGFLRDFKKFTSKEIVKAIAGSNESRREWLLRAFDKAAKPLKRNAHFKMWQDGNHPILLDSTALQQQRLDYLHNNPVEAQVVSQPQHYLFSSAIDYSGGKGMLPLVLLG